MNTEQSKKPTTLKESLSGQAIHLDAEGNPDYQTLADWVVAGRMVPLNKMNADQLQSLKQALLQKISAIPKNNDLDHGQARYKLNAVLRRIEDELRKGNSGIVTRLLNRMRGT